MSPVWDCTAPGCGFSTGDDAAMRDHVANEHPERLSYNLDRLFRGEMGLGPQEPRELALTPHEATVLAETCEIAIGNAQAANRESPPTDATEAEHDSEHLALLHHLRVRLLALHHGPAPRRRAR